MRGVVTAGMVTGLEMLGLRDVFDVVYGSSGGASNGAYFVGGQAAYGTTIYYDHINSQDFINLWRPLINRLVVDFYFVTDHVMVELVILDWKAVIDSPVPLKVLASSVENGVIEILARIPHLAKTSDAANRQLSCFSSRYMNLLAVFQI